MTRVWGVFRPGEAEPLVFHECEESMFWLAWHARDAGFRAEFAEAVYSGGKVFRAPVPVTETAKKEAA